MSSEPAAAPSGTVLWGVRGSRWAGCSCSALVPGAPWEHTSPERPPGRHLPLSVDPHWAGVGRAAGWLSALTSTSGTALCMGAGSSHVQLSPLSPDRGHLSFLQSSVSPASGRGHTQVLCPGFIQVKRGDSPLKLPALQTHPPTPTAKAFFKEMSPTPSLPFPSLTRLQSRMTAFSATFS